MKGFDNYPIIKFGIFAVLSKTQKHFDINIFPILEKYFPKTIDKTEKSVYNVTTRENLCAVIGVRHYKMMKREGRIYEGCKENRTYGS